MSESLAPSHRIEKATSRAAVLIFCGWLSVLVFLQLFVTFRGLASPMGMEHAQIARELARGNGFQTQVIAPYALGQQKARKETPVFTHQRDSANAPLAPLLMAPVFKLLESHWTFDAADRIYLLDQVVAGLSLLFFIGGLALSWVMASRLFDTRLAGWTLLVLAHCLLLWDTALAALAPMMAFFFFSLAMFCFLLVLERQSDGRSGQAGFACLLGLSAAIMVFSQWMTVWLLMGLIVSAAFLWQKRSLALWVALPTLLAFGLWCGWNVMHGGELLGMAKANLQAVLTARPESLLLRDLSATSPSVVPVTLTRKISSGITGQLGSLYSHLGWALPACLFPLALLHPFKRKETSNLRWALGIVWVFAVLGMAMVGLPEQEKDMAQLHRMFIPLFSVYGLAFLTVLWARLGFTGSTWWGRHGIALVALLISIFPALTYYPQVLVSGLTFKGTFAHWPPYLPDRITRLREMFTREEVLLSDVPWAVAWYADRPCTWLPTDRTQFRELQTLATGSGTELAGLLLTPYSAKNTEYIADIYQGNYQSWVPQIYRGFGLGMGLNTMSNDDFPLTQFLPMTSRRAENGQYVVEMFLLADRKRW